ncbi:MAG: acetyl-CoA hydrolase [Pseudohongiella sp.]|nr:acetyl-CoA hydrolase [Pseudohongiella sp.]|tara:strand:+ start:21897 stop:23834 length:1938 start_codon:yes stop_codon:yes gene_type:complete
MTTARPQWSQDAEAAVDAVLERVGPRVVLGLPLGIGKPLHFANAIYQRACRDSSISLHIVTGLSLQAPEASSSMERRFLKPFLERLYGDIPELEYARDAATGKLPENVRVSEFFFQAGNFVDQPQQQRDYVCTNYTHAVRDLMAQGMNVIAQLVSPDPSGDSKAFSLSGNPDLTLDLIPLLEQRAQDGTPTALVAETNRELPYMTRDALVNQDQFDVVIDSPQHDYPLFSVPNMALSAQDHLIGFYASTLLRDGGTLQLGIGSLGTGLIYQAIQRHSNNQQWLQLYRTLAVAQRFPFACDVGGTQAFTAGLYGCSEMMTEGFIDLLDAGVLKREVASREADDAVATLMHGGFFLGSRRFYQRLRELPDELREKICMTSVNFINDLFDHRLGDQRLKMSQRDHGRFINSAMMCTLNGAVISDGLEDGRIISGVGGQYNFVAMAHELAGARSIITLRSTRQDKGKTVSNILFNYAHCTIPRHLRDIVITEYGIADLRGQPEQEVYTRLIGLADAQFQHELLQQAKDAGKIHPDFAPPPHWQGNTPEAIKALAEDQSLEGLFPPYPFGHDFTDEELELSRALQTLKSATDTTAGKWQTIASALLRPANRQGWQPLLQRMNLEKPHSIMDRLEQRLLLWALQQSSTGRR